MAVHDGINVINSTAVLLEPLWAKSTHVMTFRAVMLEWPDHWAFFPSTDAPQMLKAARHMVVNVFKPAAAKSFQSLRLICHEWQALAAPAGGFGSDIMYR